MRTPQQRSFDGKQFFNPSGPALQPLTPVPRMLMSRRARWPTCLVDPPRTVPALGYEAVVVTFIDHSTFLIQTAAGNILTDPVYAEHVRQRPLFLITLPRSGYLLTSWTRYAWNVVMCVAVSAIKSGRIR